VVCCMVNTRPQALQKNHITFLLRLAVTNGTTFQLSQCGQFVDWVLKPASSEVGCFQM